jgi:hypothetical protein
MKRERTPPPVVPALGFGSARRCYWNEWSTRDSVTTVTMHGAEAASASLYQKRKNCSGANQFEGSSPPKRDANVSIILVSDASAAVL